MIYTESAYEIRKVVCVILAFAVLVSGCTSGSSSEIVDDPPSAAIQTALPTVVEPVETASVVPTEVPSATRVELSDDEKIAMVQAIFEADPQPSELLTWDYLDAVVLDDTVRLTICAWTGETVFDDLRLVEYRFDEAGAIAFVFDSSTPGECLNRELVESALAFTRDYDAYWGAVLDDPTTFDPETASRVMAPSHVEANAASAASWVDDGAYWQGHAYDGLLPDSSLQPIAWRSYERDGFAGVLELATCREHAGDYGLYREGVLIDDFTGAGEVSGQHSIDIYQLTRIDGVWVTVGVGGGVWADCVATDWLVGLNDWKPGPVEWELLQ